MRIGSSAALSLEKSSVKMGVPGWGTPGWPGTVAEAGEGETTTANVDDDASTASTASADAGRRHPL